jgi:hypothetical protein
MNLTEYPEYPESATTLLLGKKRKRGRPLNITAALIMQPSKASNFFDCKKERFFFLDFGSKHITPLSSLSIREKIIIIIKYIYK